MWLAATELGARVGDGAICAVVGGACGLAADKRLSSPDGQPLGRWKSGGFPRRLSGAYPTLRFGASFQRGRFALWLRLRCEPGLTAPADGENHSHPPLLAQSARDCFTRSG